MLKERAVKPKDTVGHGRLNPYFNGTCSKRLDFDCMAEYNKS